MGIFRKLTSFISLQYFDLADVFDSFEDNRFKSAAFGDGCHFDFYFLKYQILLLTNPWSLTKCFAFPAVNLPMKCSPTLRVGG